MPGLISHFNETISDLKSENERLRALLREYQNRCHSQEINAFVCGPTIKDKNLRCDLCKRTDTELKAIP